MSYNWLYTTSNDNKYIMVLVIIILGFIILDFNLWKRKTDRFDNTDSYRAPTLSNPINNMFLAPNDMAAWRKAWVQLDGNEDTIPNDTVSSVSPPFINDISQVYSNMYNTVSSNGTTPTNIFANAMNYSTIGDYATLDSLGSSLTDTLGGINSNLGFTILQEQLGTFTQPTNSNPFTYDNTESYKTGMNASTVNGVTRGSISGDGRGFSATLMQDNKPVFLQKDFAGVANIFAPNIIIANAPLTNDGIPDISFQM